MHKEDCCNVCHKVLLQENNFVISEAEFFGKKAGDISTEPSTTTLTDNSVNISAEAVAISLLRNFSEHQLPKASDLQWLVSEQDAPQAVSWTGRNDS